MSEGHYWLLGKVGTYLRLQREDISEVWFRRNMRMRDGEKLWHCKYSHEGEEVVILPT